MIYLDFAHLHLKITADQILHQDPVLLQCHVWSLLTYLDLTE